jgi:hypothetical protein
MEHDRDTIYDSPWTDTCVSCCLPLVSIYLTIIATDSQTSPSFILPSGATLTGEVCIPTDETTSSSLMFTALKGSDHLDFLLDYRLLRPISTPQIESIYNDTAPNLLNSFTFVTQSQVLDGLDLEESMLLQAGAHKLVAKSLEVPELAAEVERAVHQVKQSVKRKAEQER